MNLHTCLAAILAAGVAMVGMTPVFGSEIKVLTAGAFKQVVLALVPDFEKQTGHTVTVDNDTAGGLRRRIEGGEAFDVAVITPAVVDGLAARGIVAPGSRINLASVGIRVVVKDGAPKPDISTVEKFKRAILAAKSVTYADPELGSPSARHFLKVAGELGIADNVRAKALVSTGLIARHVAEGKAELAVQQLSELRLVEGVEVAGLFPEAIQNVVPLAGAVHTQAAAPKAAAALIALLMTARAKPIIDKAGLVPV
jgi:molybdate transport system substrate-binding protein